MLLKDNRIFKIERQAYETMQYHAIQRNTVDLVSLCQRLPTHPSNCIGTAFKSGRESQSRVTSVNVPRPAQGWLHKFGSYDSLQS